MKKCSSDKVEYTKLLENLKKEKIQEKLYNFSEKYNGKKILIYGAGLMTQVLFENFDLSSLNIVAITDIKFKEHSKFNNIDAIPVNSIVEVNPDVILVSLFEPGQALEYLSQDVFKRFVIEPLVDPNKIKNEYHPSGHYYSAIPSVEDIQEGLIRLDKNRKEIPGIKINNKKMLNSLEKTVAPFYNQFNFCNAGEQKNRFYNNNGYFESGDAGTLFAFIRKLKPKRIIECGSGFSSAVVLDTNEEFFNNKIQCTFIEPYTDRLKSLLKESDYETTTIIEKKVQDVPSEFFKKLKKNDILFIDTSHVIKFQNDVHYLYFEILPLLEKGVIVHIHDIPVGFEYFEHWITQGWNWSEAYLLRAFLMYNNSFEIIHWNSYLSKFYNEQYRKTLTNGPYNPGGSIWLRKIK